ncbi:multidrug ABC transporter ATP-binding protein [Lactobacillus amylolyticus]|uniref:ABC transporter ATP-binding protein n=1 Tax=Lactobacillus amylolyticus TaxID=83683 RepID=UPI0009BA2481|nr:ABC transporter ATP-binding protein [Lactobacillus amylolyticus]ARD07116.1 multidrug ABC transporter ATP-binding protein [Lactobacillus amylolyticus]
MLKLNDVVLSFGKKRVLDHLNLEFKQGEIIGLVAPNGTGKSTLMNVILHNLTPQEGEVEYDGLKYQNQKMTMQLHQRICAFPEQSDLFGFMTGRDHLRLYADLWHNQQKKVDDIIKLLQMGNYVDQKVQTYSLGMKQRLCFAMVVAADTPVMLLDEVMNGLDPQNVELISKVLEQLRQENKLIIIASHLLNNLQSYADRILFLGHGHVIEDYRVKEKRDLYLKIRADQEVKDILGKIAYQELPDKMLLIDSNKLTKEELGEMLSTLTKKQIPYSFASVSVEDLFDKFYN